LVPLRHEEAYKHMARYFCVLADDREHFQGQAAVVERIADYIDNPCPKILDAACGSGGVLALLAEKYKFIAGADGSPEMLAIAISDHRLKGVPISRCEWEQFPSLFMRQGPFDLVFLLGNSIAHVEDMDCLGFIASTIHDNLAPGGVIAFDVRDWVLDERSGNLVQPNRSVDCSRTLGKFNVDGEMVEITDLCSYTDGRQYITYEVKGNKVSDSFTLSYLPFSCDDALKMLTDAGLTNCEAKRYPDWKYNVVLGFKQ